jgi:hypothetical protein
MRPRTAAVAVSLVGHVYAAVFAIGELPGEGATVGCVIGRTPTGEPVGEAAGAGEPDPPAAPGEAAGTGELDPPPPPPQALSSRIATHSHAGPRNDKRKWLMRENLPDGIAMLIPEASETTMGAAFIAAQERPSSTGVFTRFSHLTAPFARARVE